MKNRKKRKTINTKKLFVTVILLIFLISFFIKLKAKYLSKFQNSDSTSVAKFNVNYEISNNDELQINCNNDSIAMPSKEIKLNNYSEVTVMAQIAISLDNQKNESIDFPEYVWFALYYEDGTQIEKNEKSNNSKILFNVPIEMNTDKNVLLKLEIDEENKNKIESLNAKVNISVTFSQVD